MMGITGDFENVAVSMLFVLMIIVRIFNIERKSILKCEISIMLIAALFIYVDNKTVENIRLTLLISNKFIYYKGSVTDFGETVIIVSALTQYIVAAIIVTFPIWLAKRLSA